MIHCDWLMKIITSYEWPVRSRVPRCLGWLPFNVLRIINNYPNSNAISFAVLRLLFLV